MATPISFSTTAGQNIDFTGAGMSTHSIASNKQISGLDDQKIKKACTEFESLFVNFLLKEMRETVPKTGFINGGKAEEYYTAMLDNEFAKEIASGKGVGLSSMLYEQLKTRNEQTTNKKNEK